MFKPGALTAPVAPKEKDSLPAVFFFGGPKGDRTPDLKIANLALSQLSYGPIFGWAGRSLPVCPFRILIFFRFVKPFSQSFPDRAGRGEAALRKGGAEPEKPPLRRGGDRGWAFIEALFFSK